MRIFTRIIALIIVFLLMLSTYAMAEMKEYQNPLINPKGITEYTVLPMNMVNILLLGIDFGHDGYWGSGYKKSLEDCHTDAIMVIAVNLDDKTADLVSLPRDTLTYVPGVRGIYKLNAAFNCGDSVEDGLQKITDAASWVLGGIKIDYYFAVDMNAMVALGDTIGGVDLKLEMAYTGHSGTMYKKGLHHLDGVGITDYLRSRKNATVNANDIGRTGRQRDLMLAIMKKLKNDQLLMMKVVAAAQQIKDGFFTNIDDVPTSIIMPLLPITMGLNEQNVGSYVITGKYKTALNGWNFTFTDQLNRQAVIKEVYGIDVPPLQYVDYAYTKWLVSAGFKSVHSISVADQLRKFVAALDQNGMTSEQQDALKAFEAAYQEAAQAFETAANTMTKADTRVMDSTRASLSKCGNELAKTLNYKGKLPWDTGKYFYADPYINEVMLDWR